MIDFSKKDNKKETTMPVTLSTIITPQNDKASAKQAGTTPATTIQSLITLQVTP